LTSDGTSLRLRVLPGRLAVARLPGTSALPAWADGPGLVSITRREGELSIVCADARVPTDVQSERGFRALEVEGPIDFQAVGVMHALTGPLARAGISVLGLATFDTDLLLVREETLARALDALRVAGYQVPPSDGA
jgi:hypothetical protein